MSVEIRPLDVSAVGLGEAPIWHRDRLLWVDIFEGQVHSTSLSGVDTTIASTTEPVSAVVVTDDDRLVLATASGVEIVSPVGHDRRWRLDAPGVGRRLNDGKVDPFGRLVVGSMIDGDGASGACLFRLSSDLMSAATVRTDLTLSNGLAWSSDGSQMFHVDTLTKVVSVHRYEEDDGPVELLWSFDTGAIVGYPDGMTIDVDDCLWIAFWDGSCIARFTPDGRVDTKIDLPVPRPTSATFAGDGLDVLAVTSASFGLDAAARAAAPLSGHLFLIDGVGCGHPATPLATTSEGAGS